MREIPKKNYIIYSIIVVITISAVLYLNSWYTAYKQNQLNNSYISKYVHEINYEEFKNYSVENPNLIVYIGSTNCESCIKVEKDFYKIIEKNELIENVIFLNVTNLPNINDLNNDFGKEELKLNYTTPSIAILKDSKFIDIINDTNENNIKSDLIVQLLEENQYIK